MDILIEFLHILLLALLGLSGVVGLLAVASPNTFSVVCSHARQVVHSGGQTRVDRWFDIDNYVLQNARLFGLFIIVSEALIWFLANHGPESYSKSFLLVSFCVALLLGALAMGHVLRQKREIETKLAEAHTDSLTGLANRRAFDAELARRLAQFHRQATPLCLMIIDIDEFKSFNDTFGHLQGDAILKQVASTLLATGRQMDSVARLGGDEFAIVLPGISLDEASHAAERFRAAVGGAWQMDEHALTISSGVAAAQCDDDVTSLIKRADAALYAAKGAGRNCCFRHPGPELAAVTGDIEADAAAAT